MILFIYFILFILSLKLTNLQNLHIQEKKQLWQNFGLLIYVNYLYKCLYQLKILEPENLKLNKAPKTKHTTVA